MCNQSPLNNQLDYNFYIYSQFYAVNDSCVYYLIF